MDKAEGKRYVMKGRLCLPGSNHGGGLAKLKRGSIVTGSGAGMTVVVNKPASPLKIKLGRPGSSRPSRFKSTMYAQNVVRQALGWWWWGYQEG
jgi:hypothetical protein